jgi:hypothetical protein
MPNRIDPPVHDVQLTTIEASVDGASPDPTIEKLPSRHQPVLAFGQMRDQSVDPLLLHAPAPLLAVVLPSPQ